MVRETKSVGRCRKGFAIIVMTAACVGAACDGPASAAPPLDAGAEQEQAGSTAPALPPLRLEFELPQGFGSAGTGAGDAVVGFQVGYFLPGPVRTPVKLIDIPRTEVTVQGNLGRISVPRESLPQGANRVELRIRARGAQGFSAWSDPTAAVTLPALAGRTPRSPSSRASNNGTERTPREGRRREGLAVAQLEQHARLKAALQPLLPQDLSLEDAVRPFRNVQDLAEAVVLSRQLKLPFDELRKEVEGPPARSLRQALTALRPSVDARRVIRQARGEARGLVSATK